VATLTARGAIELPDKIRAELDQSLRIPSPLVTKHGAMAMGRYVLLWLLGVPIPILILIWALGGLH